MVAMSAYKTIGFIGLGVMGEPICRNLVKKSGRRVIAFVRSVAGGGRQTTGSIGGLDTHSRFLDGSGYA